MQAHAYLASPARRAPRPQRQRLTHWPAGRGRQAAGAGQAASFFVVCSALYLFNSKKFSKMGLFEKFKNKLESGELKRKKSHLKNLYMIAMADGRMANEEFEFILHVASKMYVSPEVVREVIQFQSDIEFYIPVHDREKLDQIHDCVGLAIIDGDLNDKELALCKLIAMKFGFRPVVVDAILESIISSIVKGLASDAALNKLLSEL